jgi:hypothetical protein
LTDDLDGTTTPEPETGRRRWFGRRRAERGREAEQEPVAEPPASEPDWQAVVTDAGLPPVEWTAWSPESAPVEERPAGQARPEEVGWQEFAPSPEGEPAGAAPNGAGEAGGDKRAEAEASPSPGAEGEELTVAVWETLSEAPAVSAGEVSPAAVAPEAAVAAAMETGGAVEEEEARYRTTLSWPPPRKPRIAAGLLSLLTIGIMVALLATNGQFGSAGDEVDGNGRELPSINTDPEAVPKDWILFRQPSSGFAISYPRGWEVRDDGRAVRIKDSASTAELHIDRRRPPGDADPQDEWLEQERLFSARAQGYRRLQLSAASYQGHPAALWEYTYSEGTTAIHAADLEFVTKKDRITLNFRGPVSEWQRLLPTFQGFLSSFKAPK